MSFSIGILIAGYTGSVGVFWSHVVLVAALIATLISLRLKPGIYRFAGIALFAILGFHLTIESLDWGKDFDPGQSERLIQANVRKMWASNPSYKIILLEHGVDVPTGAPLPGYGRLFLRDNKLELTAGDLISFRARIRKPVNRGNPGEYDWENDCKQNGILWLASVAGKNSVVVVEKGRPWTPGAILFKARSEMESFISSKTGKFFRPYLESDMEKDIRAVLKGIVIGDMGEIGYDLNESFAKSGLAHMLSASGLHVGIVALMTLFAVGMCVRVYPKVLLWMPLQRLGALFCIPAVICYCIIVGSRVPAVRSAIMGTVIAMGVLMDKRWNSFNSLALAALTILMIYPTALFTPSFQLSFAAVAGIFYVFGKRWAREESDADAETNSQVTAVVDNDSPGDTRQQTVVVNKVERLMKYFKLLLLTGASATIATFPLIVGNFYRFPIWSLPANVMADMAMALSLGFGLIAACTALVWPSVAELILIPAQIFTWLTIKIAFWFSSLKYSTIAVEHLTLFQSAPFIVIAAVLLWFLREPKRKRLGTVALIVFLSTVWTSAYGLFCRPADELKVVFLNVGKGDAIFIKPPASSGILIDGGSRDNYFDAGKSIVEPFMKWAGVRCLDAICISHPEMDHMGGVLSVMDQIPAKALWWNPVKSDSEHLKKILEKARSEGTTVQAVNQGHGPSQLGDAALEFLNPGASESGLGHKDMNNASVVCRISYGNVSFLFTGDLENLGENELLSSRSRLSSTVLKVSHHGGKGGTSSDFLLAVRPKVAVISAEYPPASGLPSHAVLERLESCGTRVFWTGRDGAVTLQTDGTRLYATTGKSGPETKKSDLEEINVH